MVHPLLNDKNTYPDDKILARCLGKSKIAWDSFLDLLKVDYPQISTEWRYYNDGKSWLFKVTKKTKTICWVSVGEGFSKVGFYFSSKAEEAIKDSALDSTIKNRWLKNGKNDKFRSIAVELRTKKELKTIKELIEIKGKIK